LSRHVFEVYIFSVTITVLFFMIQNCHFLTLPVNGWSELKSDFYKNIFKYVKACFWSSLIICNYNHSLLYYSKLPFSWFYGGSELKIDIYKNILEYFKVSFCFYVNFFHCARSTLLPITHWLTDWLSQNLTVEKIKSYYIVRWVCYIFSVSRVA